MTVLAGGLAAWLLRSAGSVVLLLYAANWLAFTLYSVPPFRWKVRGGRGVLADTCGGQFLPTLWIALCATSQAGGRPEPRLLWPLGIWAFALGLRGILSHQLRDWENDREAGVQTYVVGHGPAAVRCRVAWLIFPIETAALLTLLWQLRWPSSGLLVGLHLWIEIRRPSFFSRRLNWSGPLPEQWLLWAEYDKFYFPITFALALATLDRRALWLVPLHFVLFRKCSGQFLRDLRDFCIPGQRKRASGDTEVLEKVTQVQPPA